MLSFHDITSVSRIRLLRVHWPASRNLQIYLSSAFIRFIKCWRKQHPGMCTLISEAFSNMACREDNSAWEMEKSPSRAFWARTLASCRSYSICEERDTSNSGHRSTASSDYTQNSSIWEQVPLLLEKLSASFLPEPLHFPEIEERKWRDLGLKCPESTSSHHNSTQSVPPTATWKLLASGIVREG